MTQLAQKADIHRNTVLNYLIYLENARLIRLVQAKGAGISILHKPGKIYLNNSNLAFALATDVPNMGTLRETFFASQVGVNHSLTIPDEGDFLVDGKILFEIGGQQKSHRQIADLNNSYVIRDGIEFAVGKKLPLWLFGFLY